MSRMGKGSGSEWHLAQHLRHRRGELGITFAQAIGRRFVGWLAPPWTARRENPPKSRNIVKIQRKNSHI